MIHSYKLGGMNIVLDIYSGSVHVVDEVAYDIIGMFQENSREQILAAMAEKYANRDDITENDIAECYADPTKAYEVLGWRAERDLKKMCEDAARWQKMNPDGYPDD